MMQSDMCSRRSGKGLRAALRHAFAMPAEQPLTDRQRQWLEALARRVVERGLATPALLLLGSIQPVSFVGAQAVVFFTPIMSVIFPPQVCEELTRLLEQHPALAALMQAVERYDAEAKAAKGCPGDRK